LFNYFNSKENGIVTNSIFQILWGYIPNKLKPEIEVDTKEGGVFNIPQFGYFKYTPNQKLAMCWDRFNNKVVFKKMGVVIDIEKHLEVFLKNTEIRFCQNETNILKIENKSNLLEPIESTLLRFKGIINNAWDIMKNIVPGFCKLIELTTKEITIFNCPFQESKAAFSQYGRAFINVKGEDHNEVFFIDDLAHQCGHILFYALTMPPNEYLIPAPRTLLKVFTHIDWDERDIYGCLHGLFTYTTILHCLDKCLENEIFKDVKKHEAIGRLCFYMEKFGKDLALMNNPLILSKKGWEMFDLFKDGYESLYKKYKITIRKINFSNQTYIFNYNLFQQTNPMNLFE
jgi:hypothetical protein